MSRTYRQKLPYFDEDCEWNIKISRGTESANIPLRDPDIDYREADGIRGKREAKKRMAKKHRQDRRIDLRNRKRDFEDYEN